MTTPPNDPTDRARHPQQPAEGDSGEVDDALGRRDEATSAPSDESASDADAGDA